MGDRRKARELALQMLFQVDMTSQSVEEVFTTFFASHKFKPEVVEFAQQVVKGSVEHRKEIDRLISTTTEHWKMDRMATVDRNILRIAVYEFLYEETVPKKVAINEALEIAKKYSTAESVQFINGVLDGIKKKLEKQPAPNTHSGEKKRDNHTFSEEKDD
ncbi:MAG: transcription antitermination factor NusB [Acidobacteriota bacterium]